MGACNSKSEDKGKKQYSAPDFVNNEAGHHSNIAVHQGSVLGIASRGNLIASCGDDKLISLSDRKLLQSRSTDLYQPISLSGHEKAVNRVHFDTHNGLLYSASRDLSIRLVIAHFSSSHRTVLSLISIVGCKWRRIGLKTSTHDSQCPHLERIVGSFSSVPQQSSLFWKQRLFGQGLGREPRR